MFSRQSVYTAILVLLCASSAACYQSCNGNCSTFQSTSIVKPAVLPPALTDFERSFMSQMLQGFEAKEVHTKPAAFPSKIPSESGSFSVPHLVQPAGVVGDSSSRIITSGSLGNHHSFLDEHVGLF
ncbi:hypothetical protein GUITHDRAFT_151640 [Guillardia theta CCMP2712]|uniref:Uncharacterized protein n=1 Tax=Guillardia theta (strain CCMP2712) TaxID=905079 RepID=L1JM15_GUITC|nr:hypothetical protein GUITHDRAFT_151640 [Guillardia theta CCMP2712]EKX49200.1 hypothetical protein GUITHDRAFT_151640 [Guillardia theta CCMP2712]|mmetsp:Transcript_18086/g.59403  ORF Transcript_18086/g.59403 Transcript_18086/m.59403 type:complete len:126 (-) Transcript_18086:571-948(-)|eukprot:XP_005836180.1 hypothetical protein GUITHDRAFT_151640 [Guillardia theta CCMP2712]